MDMAINKVINFSPCIRIAQYALNALDNRIYGDVFGASFKVNIIIAGYLGNRLVPLRVVNLRTDTIYSDRTQYCDIEGPAFLKLETKSFNRIFN